jgi:DNA-binding NtrC family response regulator
MPKRRNQRLKGCRVLVIEDEYFLADDLDRVLRDEGAEVIGPVGSRSEAMTLIDRDGFDIAVIDLNLRDESAYPLADELDRQGIPFIFATGYASAMIPEKYSRILRWEKPYELEDIVEGLAPLCDSAMKKQRADRPDDIGNSNQL